jgi:hypothetical protein
MDWFFQDAVRHNSGNHAAGFANREHMLGEHQVALLAGRRGPTPAETLRILHVRTRIILTERRIGDDAIKAFKLTRLSVHRMEQRVLELYVGAGNTVEKHVQLADRPGGSIVDLSTKANVSGIAARLLYEFAADDEHAA